MREHRKLALANLNELFSSWGVGTHKEEHQRSPTPFQGWLRTVRESVGMSRRQLARRMSLSHSVLEKLERSEVKKTISIQSLEKVADALGCDVAVVFIPRQPMEDFILENAKIYVKKQLMSVEDSMALEDPSISEAALNEKIETLAEDLLNKESAKIWGE